LKSRATFISRTYAHLVAAIGAFTLIEIYLFKDPACRKPLPWHAGSLMDARSGGFVLVSWLASRVAHMSTSKPAQYAALAGFVAAEAIIFVPFCSSANHSAPGVITALPLLLFLVLPD
jgi:hypothetical protein